MTTGQLTSRLDSGVNGHLDSGEKRGRATKRAIIVVLIIVLGILYFNETFDHAPVNIALNAKPCIRNGFGATSCGSEVTTYCTNLANAGLNTSNTGCANYTTNTISTPVNLVGTPSSSNSTDSNGQPRNNDPNSPLPASD